MSRIDHLRVRRLPVSGESSEQVFPNPSPRPPHEPVVNRRVREAVRLIRDRGVSYAQASEDLKVHPTQLRSWVKAFASDPQQAFPGQGQMKPEQAEIARLKREVLKLKAERDILKKAAAYFAKEST